MRVSRQLPVVAAVLLSMVVAGCGGGGGDGTSPPGVGPATAVSAVSGSNASVAAGTTTPIALTAKVADAGGHGVAGATVTWGTSSGSISPATASTDGNGQVSAQWTLGKLAGPQSATASVSGVGAATFTATINPGPLAKIKLLPDTTKLGAAGTTAQLNATGLDAFDNVVSGFTPVYSIDDPQIATVNGAGLLTSVKTGTTTVRATSGGVSGSAIVIVNTAVADPCAGVTMTLAVGASQTLTGTAASQFCVNGAAGAEFVAVPFNATGNGSLSAATLPLTFTPLANTAAAGPPTPTVLANAARANVVSAGGTTLTRDIGWEMNFRLRTRPELNTLLRASRKNRALSQAGPRPRLSISTSTVSVGQVLMLNVNVASPCGPDSLVVPATVKAVSNHAIVVADNRNPAELDYNAIASAFDNQVWTTDTDNFGVPYAWNWTTTPARDPNGKMILFFTVAVNQLTPQNQSSFVGGFFYGRDLYPKKLGTTAVCPTSNEAEMFYLLAPDPNKQFNNVRSVAFVQSITTGTVAHEFQHLINSAYRVFVPDIQFKNSEDTFLDEGLAHIAEELNYYTATGLAARTNLDANTATSNTTNWVAFGDQNATRFREYLKNPDKYPPYSVLADTSLAVRGGIWSFLRYATDRRVAAGKTEKSTWFDLVNPPQELNGVDHLAAVFGSDVLSQMRDWAVANYLDDAGVSNSAASLTHPSWNTRSVETFVNGPSTSTLPHANGTVFPLKVQPLTTSPFSVSLADGGAAYLRFGIDVGKVGGATVSSSAALPSSFSVTVIRTK